MDEELKKSEDIEGKEHEENKSAISADLIRGHINTIILRTLYDRDKYGYEIMDEIEAKSHGQYSLKQPTLYSALKRLESQGYINAYWKTDEVSNGGRRKYYTLTESGREITERNQNEWEYSRTVIDSLISDRNFDFNQPAPTPVDFKILKSSTTRVPTVKDVEEKSRPNEQVSEQSAINTQTTENNEQVQPIQQPAAPVQEAPVQQQPTNPVEPVQPAYAQAPEQIQTEQIVYQQRPVQPVQPVYQQPIYQQPVQQPQAAPVNVRTAEQLNEERIRHENYLRLITEPVAEVSDNTMPYSDRINTEKLIYNNKPETERDYKNLLEKLFNPTINPPVQAEPRQASKLVEQSPVAYSDATVKATSDGLTVNSTEQVITGKRKARYNRGNTLVKCSLIVTVIMLVEFALSLAFKTALNVSISYPIVILTLAFAQLLIFLILTTTEFGKSSRKPTTHSYLSATIIMAIISIAIIIVFSLLLNINFAEIGDIVAKIIIPSLVALNIPIFATLFYIFSK